MTKAKKRTPSFMTLKVVLWGNELGRLLWDGRKGVSVFAYSKEFLAGGLDVSPLDMSTP